MIKIFLSLAGVTLLYFESLVRFGPSVRNFCLYAFLAIRIFLLYVAPLHGHQLIHSQCLHDACLSLTPWGPLHTQTVRVPHTLDPQFAEPNPSL